MTSEQNTPQADLAFLRRPWRSAVALGWFAAAAAMVAATSIPAFIAIAGLAMLLLTARPGAIMWRAAQEVRP